MARRETVDEAEAHVAKQVALVQRLRDKNLPTELAASFLHELQASLRDHRRDRDELYRQRSEGFRDVKGDPKF